jgi:HAD superfamily hydrolase (TIGR01509 family)
MKAVIFDMDGVIVDSERQWKNAETAFFARLLGSWDPARNKEIVGMGVVDLYHWLVKELGLKCTKEHFLAECDVLAKDVYGRHVTCAEGFPELIADLKRAGLALGLASSSPRHWIDMVLERFALRPHFGAIASGDDAPGRVKPHPDLYLLAATNLGVAPADCVAIEDSFPGVTAAKRAGMKCVAFRNGHNDQQDLSQADVEIRTFVELDAQALRRALSMPAR